MVDFFEELAEGEIHQRDKFQFELKSEYSPIQAVDDPSYTTEFFLFIPQALQINQETYNKKEFYRDQTSFIRYKTPLLTLDQLVSDTESKSPIVVLRNKIKQKGKVSYQEALFELKLFANITRSRLRDLVRDISKKLYTSENLEEVNRDILRLLEKVSLVKESLKRFNKEFFECEEHQSLKQDWAYIDEYISVMIQHYLTNLLEMVRKFNMDLFSEADEKLCRLIVGEEEFRNKKKFGTSFTQDVVKETSRAVYRMGLLNKYIFEVLFLKIKRKEPKRRMREISASFAAAFAMLIYLVLLTWQGKEFVIDSTAFIALAVLLYVLKDRMKEGVRNWSTKLGAKWYPDYNTDILSPDNDEKIGKVTEFFSFLDRDKIPDEVKKIREDKFHDELDKIRRQETVIYYKKNVEILPQAVKKNKRLHKVNDIFRYNLSQFLLKASDASADYHFLDPITEQLETLSCSKLYHVNIILKKTFTTKNLKRRIELDKFRIILDKEGIKRIEKV